MKYEIRKKELDDLWSCLLNVRSYIKERNPLPATKNLQEVMNILMNLRKVKP